MQSLLDEGFVVRDRSGFEFLGPVVSLTGRIRCLGGIEVTVLKTLRVLSGEDLNAMVQTVKYTYHAQFLNGVRIFRYDSPVQHRNFHHKHVFDTFGTGDQVDVKRIDQESEVPTLREVLVELCDWYWANQDDVALVAAKG